MGIRSFIRSFFEPEVDYKVVRPTGREKYERLLEYIRNRANRSPMHYYMLEKFNSYIVHVNPATGEKTYTDPATHKTYNFNEAVRKARQSGILRYAHAKKSEAQANLRAAQASHNAAAIVHAQHNLQHWKDAIGHGLTRTQKGQELGFAEARAFRAEGVTPLYQSASKRIKSNIYVVLISFLIGIFLYIGTPFFGLPSFPILAIAFIFTLPAYILLPGQYNYLQSIKEGRNIGRKAWVLLPKSIFKIATYVLIIYQFFIYNRLISLMFAFFFYFTLPFRYKTSQPYKMMEAWIRMGFGAYLAFIFLMAFSGTPVGFTLAMMAFAFFFTFPIQIPGDAEESKVMIFIGKGGKNLLQHKGLQVFDKLFFIVLMIFSLIWTALPSSGGIGMIHWIFYGIWGLSFFVGLFTGPEGRPPIGAVAVLITLFVFSSTYPGVIGQAVFGYWWPQVQSFTEMINDYVGPVWEQARNSIGDAWLILTNPQQYYLNQMIKQTVTPSVITPGGTIKSIELTRFELTTSIAGILEPSEPTIGMMELSNEGDFSSGRINLAIGAVYIDPEYLTEDPVGSISSLFCSGNPTGSNSTSIGGPAYCEWSGNIYPKEARSITFKLDEGNAWDYLFNDCMDNTDPSSPSSCPCFTASCPFGNTTYEYSGHSVKLKVNLTYDYIVNVSLPITIINSNLYLKKLQAGEIVLQDLTSEYTGGPVKATLFTAKQPARTDIPFLVTASIFNEGSGDLLNITNFTITIYGAGAISDVEVIGETFRKSDPSVSPTPDGCTDASGPDGNGNWEIRCENIWGTIEKGEFKRVSFYITPDSSITDEKTTQIVAWADYEYKKTTSQTLTMANAPPQ